MSTLLWLLNLVRGWLPRAWVVLKRAVSVPVFVLVLAGVLALVGVRSLLPTHADPKVVAKIASLETTVKIRDSVIAGLEKVTAKVDTVRIATHVAATHALKTRDSLVVATRIERAESPPEACDTASVREQLAVRDTIIAWDSTAIVKLVAEVRADSSSIAQRDTTIAQLHDVERDLKVQVQLVQPPAPGRSRWAWARDVAGGVITGAALVSAVRVLLHR